MKYTLEQATLQLKTVVKNASPQQRQQMDGTLKKLHGQMAAIKAVDMKAEHQRNLMLGYVTVTLYEVENICIGTR